MIRKLLLIASTALALTLGSAGTAHADAQYRFWQFNMCGQNADCPNQGNAETTGIVGDVRDSIESFKPAGVSLNEICYSQYQKLMSELNSRGYWAMEGRFITTTTEPNSCEPDNFGNAVLSRKPILSAASYPLYTSDGNEPRRMICVRAAFPIETRLCSVHITRNANDQPWQIAQVADVVDAWVKQNGPVVLMGDFNVPPYHQYLDRLYDNSHANGIGYFQEVDELFESGGPCRCGEPTVGSTLKYDYIFVSAKHWYAVDGDATSADRSDHDPLRGWAYMYF